MPESLESVDLNPGRTEQMIAAYASGATLQAIGDEWAVSRERVRQLINRVIPTTDLKPASRWTKRSGWEEFDPEDPRWRYGWSDRSLLSRAADDRRRTKRREMIAQVHQWKARTGRDDPSFKELRAITGRGVVAIASLWGKPHTSMETTRSREYRRYCDRFRRVCGIRARPCGNPGHLPPR